MDTRSQFAGLRFLDVRRLKGAPVLDADATTLGSVAAVLPFSDGTVHMLVGEDAPRGRVLRLPLDELEIDELGRLWRRPAWSACRIALRVPVAPLPVETFRAESLTER